LIVSLVIEVRYIIFLSLIATLVIHGRIRSVASIFSVRLQANNGPRQGESLEILVFPGMAEESVLD